MTVEIFKNFLSKNDAEDLVKGAEIFLEEPEGRYGFFEDMRPRIAVPKEKYSLSQVDPRALDEDSKKADILICDSLYRIREKVANFYNVELNSYDGGLAKLMTGAKNGLHADMYRLDGSPWNDESGREDEKPYSALLYLSDYGTDFTGGEIIFPKQGLTIYPEKGMLVFFRGDLDHPHEVKEILSGSRYAIVTFLGKE
jgi:hypothetical protein